MCLALALVDFKCLLNICDDYAAGHKIAFNCNERIGVSFSPKSMNNLQDPSNVFLNGARVQ